MTFKFRLSRLIPSLLLMSCLVACSGEGSNESAIDEKPRGVIPQSQLDALGKAAGVSEVLEKAEEDRRKQMEAQGI